MSDTVERRSHVSTTLHGSRSERAGSAASQRSASPSPITCSITPRDTEALVTEDSMRWQRLEEEDSPRKELPNSVVSRFFSRVLDIIDSPNWDVLQCHRTSGEFSTQRACIAVLLIALIGLCVLSLGVAIVNIRDSHELRQLRFPTSIGQIKEAHDILMRYVEVNRLEVMMGFSAVYIIFGLPPARLFYNILAGALFGFAQAAILCVILTIIATAMGYCISQFVLKDICWRWFPNKMEKFASKIERHGDHLFIYMLALRLFPFSPHLFIDIASPLVNVPFRVFFLATAAGLTPSTVLLVHAGLSISELRSTRDAVPTSAMMSLLSLAVLALGVALLKRRIVTRRPRSGDIARTIDV